MLNLDDATYGGPVRGYNFLMNIKNQVYAINMFDYVLEGRAGDEEGAGPWRSYFLGMRKIILAIKEANPNVRIVIGNFFSQHSSYVNAEFANSEYSDYEYFTSLICYFNEAIAGFHGLDIVNPYKYIWLNDSDFPKITSDPQYGVYVKTEDIDPTKFCPDGVHPTNPDAVQAIADVYIRELERILGSNAN